MPATARAYDRHGNLGSVISVWAHLDTAGGQRQSRMLLAGPTHACFCLSVWLSARKIKSEAGKWPRQMPKAHVDKYKLPVVQLRRIRSRGIILYKVRLFRCFDPRGVDGVGVGHLVLPVSTQ